MFIINYLDLILVNYLNPLLTILFNHLNLLIKLNVFLGIIYFILYSKGIKEGLKIIRDISLIGASSIFIYKPVGGEKSENDSKKIKLKIKMRLLKINQIKFQHYEYFLLPLLPATIVLKNQALK